METTGKKAAEKTYRSIYCVYDDIQRAVDGYAVGV